jgi:hypothetical protein
MQATTIRIPAGLIERLRKAAKEDGRSMNNLINKALADFVKVGNPTGRAYADPSHKPFPISDNSEAVTDEQKEINREIMRKIKSTM